MTTTRIARQSFVIAFAACALSARAEKLPARPSTRSMDELNWMEFRKLVPSKVDTVLLTVGTLEPHGVINNGADNTAPQAIARALADEVNALIAPHVSYGVTGAMAPYPGAIHIPEDAFRGYLHAILNGLVKNGFRHLVIINGHGGPQTAILESLAREVALEQGVMTLTVNWWTLCSDVTQEVFGEDGGHAGINETAFVQAIDPRLVHKELYTGPEMATPNPAPGAWSATPFPSSISLYKPGQGWPKDFDQKKADTYYKKVIAKVGQLIKDTVHKWQAAGFK